MKEILKDDNVSFLSFDPDGSQSSYELHALDQHIIQNIKDTLEKLERIPQVHLCARGDCFLSSRKHDEFFDVELAKLFIVGGKAKSHFKANQKREIKYHQGSTASSDGIDSVKVQLKSLIKECNEIVKSKRKSDNVGGKISKECIDFILGQSQTSLQRWTIFFLSFLHNSGNAKDFKQSSPYLSLTHGNDKIEIAKRFALERCQHHRGIVFIYSLNSNWPYYFLAQGLADQLETFGVRWYTDIHREVLLLNGMYPHFLIGILEVSKNGVSKFILNPWIYGEFKQGNEFNYTEGVRIDQRRFPSFAEGLGYQSWFFHETGMQLESISDLDKFEPKKVYRV